MPKKEIINQPKKTSSKTEINQALVDNFVNLQKVLTNLALRFDELSSNIEKLLNIFEITAKNLAEKQSNVSMESDKDFLKKLDDLLDQNKTISKGILLMEEKVRNRMGPQPIQIQPRFPSKPLPLPRN